MNWHRKPAGVPIGSHIRGLSAIHRIEVYVSEGARVKLNISAIDALKFRASIPDAASLDFAYIVGRMH
jgi:hypothetical protein